MPSKYMPDIHMFGKLKNGESFEAYLNTFYCPVQPWAGSREEDSGIRSSEFGMEDDGIEKYVSGNENPAISLRPNPTTGLVIVDMNQWLGQSVQLRLINAQGQQVLSRGYAIEDESLELNLDRGLANGLYFLVVQPSVGAKATATFLLER